MSQDSSAQAGPDYGRLFRLDGRARGRRRGRQRHRPRERPRPGRPRRGRSSAPTATWLRRRRRPRWGPASRRTGSTSSTATRSRRRPRSSATSTCSCSRRRPTCASGCWTTAPRSSTGWSASTCAASFDLVRAFGAGMAERGRGSIIGFSSIRAVTVEPGQGVYAATKAGLVQLLRTAAAELGPCGVRVNAVAPASSTPR